jgi:hypothetical protein
MGMRLQVREGVQKLLRSIVEPETRIVGRVLE